MSLLALLPGEASSAIAESDDTAVGSTLGNEAVSGIAEPSARLSISDVSVDSLSIGTGLV